MKTVIATIMLGVPLIASAGTWQPLRHQPPLPDIIGPVTGRDLGPGGASFPLLLLLIGIFMLLATPLSNWFSRHLEHEADRFGLEITQDNQAAGEAFIVLQHGNLANPRPGPIYNFWRNTHPALGERVDFCNSYCPWNEQEPLEYGKYFKE